jgi:hypothetical protein
MFVHSCWSIILIVLSAKGFEFKVYLNSNRFEFGNQERNRKGKGKR